MTYKFSSSDEESIFFKQNILLRYQFGTDDFISSKTSNMTLLRGSFSSKNSTQTKCTKTVINSI